MTLATRNSAFSCSSRGKRLLGFSKQIGCSPQDNLSPDTVEGGGLAELKDGCHLQRSIIVIRDAMIGSGVLLLRECTMNENDHLYTNTKR